jgi:daunorubicin resistance ABC transporter ATP-binding subunit
MPDQPAIEVAGLTKRFGDVVALDGVDLRVAPGTVYGLLGPNGAGKTTTVRVLTTIIRPDAGTARVLGLDVTRDADRVRASIGLAGQYAAVDESLTGRENLRLVGQLAHRPRPEVRARTEELLERFGLAHAGDRTLKTYSGGMRRRLDLAASLVHRPPVLFLDEPTTGLDPKSRSDLWQVIRELVADGTTLLLTTQYLEEADQLADRIAVIDRGTVIADGTAASSRPSWAPPCWRCPSPVRPRPPPPWPPSPPSPRARRPRATSCGLRSTTAPARPWRSCGPSTPPRSRSPA